MKATAMKRSNWVLKIGTYKCPDHKPEHIGIDEPMSKNYIGQMLEPHVKWRKQEDASASQNDRSFTHLPTDHGNTTH